MTDLRPWGYAPGGYTFTCHDCPPDQPINERPFAAKRSVRCEKHALEASIRYPNGFERGAVLERNERFKHFHPDSRLVLPDDCEGVLDPTPTLQLIRDRVANVEEEREDTTLEEVIHRIREGTFYDDYDWASGPALRALDQVAQQSSDYSGSMLSGCTEFSENTNQSDALAVIEEDRIARLLSELSRSEKRCTELEAAEHLTYVVQHSPNCPSPYLVRLPRGAIDMKPYHETGDAFGFGATFAEAFSAARAALSTVSERKR